MRVLHIGDISGTSRAVITVANAKGLDWSLHQVPLGRGSNMAAIAGRRLFDFLRTRFERPKADVLHINYGVSGYYGWFRKGVVLHLHGTDVRQDLQSAVLGPVVRRSIRSADAVLYSTPDMAEQVRALRPDAEWFPAPLQPSAETLLAPSRPRDGRHVFFASRWDDSKGAPDLVKLAARLKEARPELELSGVNWGTHASEAAAAGVRLLPHLSSDDFRQHLADADVVIGQLAFGVLGLSDLEAMAQGRPLVAKFTAAEAYGSEAPIANTTASEPFDRVLKLLTDTAGAEELGTAARRWALEHHAASALEERLEGLYEKVLGSARPA